LIDRAKAWAACWLEEHAVARLLICALGSYGAHACGVFAAAIAFFGVLSLFPLLLLLITLFAAVVKASDAMALVLDHASAFFPGSSDLVLNAIDTVRSTEPAFVGVGLGGLLWSSMGVFMALGYALNRVWNIPKDRHILVQYGIAAGLTLSVGLVVIASFILSALADLAHFVEGIFIALGLPGFGVLTLVGSSAVNIAIVASSLAFLYRFLPNVYVEWRDVLIPALSIALLGGAARFGFSWYLIAVAGFDRIYGPLAAIAGLMLWMFVAAVLLLFGAELSHQLALLRAGRGRREPPRLAQPPAWRATL